jgi:hypothetical protein
MVTYKQTKRELVDGVLKFKKFNNFLRRKGTLVVDLNPKNDRADFK